MTSFSGHTISAKNDIILGQANNNDMPPYQKSKQSWGANLSLYKYWLYLSYNAVKVCHALIKSDHFCRLTTNRHWSLCCSWEMKSILYSVETRRNSQPPLVILCMGWHFDNLTYWPILLVSTEYKILFISQEQLYEHSQLLKSIGTNDAWQTFT